MLTAYKAAEFMRFAVENREVFLKLFFPGHIVPVAADYAQVNIAVSGVTKGYHAHAYFALKLLS